MSWPSGISAAYFLHVVRTYGDAFAITRMSCPEREPRTSQVNFISSGSFTPGSFVRCSLCSFKLSISFSFSEQIVTSCPLLQSRRPRAVPQLPAPMMLIFAIFYFSDFLDKYVFRSVPAMRRLMFARCSQKASTARSAITTYIS